jgi:hypothetical protein
MIWITDTQSEQPTYKVGKPKVTMAPHKTWTLAHLT